MKNVVITILAVLVLSLGGYLVYEKVISNNNKKGARLHTIKSKIKIAFYAERNKLKKQCLNTMFQEPH